MTHTTPLKDSDDSIFRHFLRQRTLVFGFLLGIIVGRATLHFLPAIQVGEPKRLETLSTKNAQEVREQSQSESVVRVPAASVARVQAEKPGLLEDRANHLMYPVNTLEVDVLRTMGLCTLIAEWARRDFNGVIRWLRSTDIGDRKSLYVGMAL